MQFATARERSPGIGLLSSTPGRGRAHSRLRTAHRRSHLSTEFRTSTDRRSKSVFERLAGRRGTARALEQRGALAGMCCRACLRMPTGRSIVQRRVCVRGLGEGRELLLLSKQCLAVLDKSIADGSVFHTGEVVSSPNGIAISLTKIRGEAPPAVRMAWSLPCPERTFTNQAYRRRSGWLTGFGRRLSNVCVKDRGSSRPRLSRRYLGIPLANWRSRSRRRIPPSFPGAAKLDHIAEELGATQQLK